MTSNQKLFATAILVIIITNIMFINWLAPSTSEISLPLENLLKEQTTSIAKLQSNVLTSVDSINEEVSQLNSKLNLLETKVETNSNSVTQISDLQSAQTNPSPADATAQVADEATKEKNDLLLSNIDKKFADLQQQVASLQSVQNQSSVTDNNTDTPLVDDPYAGMTPEQSQQAQEIALANQKQTYDTAISSTVDPGKASNISGELQSAFSTAGIVDTVPEVSCGSELCKLSVPSPLLKKSDGSSADPTFTLMSSGILEGDSRIISIPNQQGGVDIYFGKQDSGAF